MGLISKKVLGISVTTDSKKDILEYVQKYLLQTQNSKLKTQNRSVKPLVIVTPNPEQIVLAQQDKRFANILNQADVAIPDGVGLVAAMRLLDQSSAVSHQSSDLKRIPGVEFLEDLVKIAAKEGYTIGLIGGRGGVAVKALECLKRKNPGLTGWTEEPWELEVGDLGDLRDLRDKITKTNTRLVFVGLGALKQEYFIKVISRQLSAVSKKSSVISHQSSDHLKAESWKLKTLIVFMSVGGSFDIIAGKTPRAPQAIQAIGLEWLWRLIRQPWRWRRQIALVKFLWLVVREKVL